MDLPGPGTSFLSILIPNPVSVASLLFLPWGKGCRKVISTGSHLCNTAYYTEFWQILQPSEKYSNSVSQAVDYYCVHLEDGKTRTPDAV